jgi:hypothetical protein
VELVIRGLNSGGEQQVDLQNIQIYVSINGKYSLNTTPDVDCIEGVFSFKTIKPIKSGVEGQGYCGIGSGEIEVNNAKIEFSSGKVKVSVENQQKEYGCDEVEGLCKYEPIEIPQIEIIEEDGEEIVMGTCPVWFKDADKDGYTDGTTKVSCEKPSDEYISSQTAWDCDDNDPNINPGKTEICDGKDNNCNGQKDEGNVCGSASTFAKKIGSSNDDEAWSIIQSSDGGYAVAGWTSSFGAGNWDFYVVKLDSAGNVVWTKTIGGSFDDEANSIIQSSDGGYVVAGYTESFGAGYPDMYVVKMDANGNVCFSQNITNYSVSSTVPSFSSPSTTAFPQSPTVNSVSPAVASYASSVSDVCASAPAPHLCSASQDCGFSSAVETNKEYVKSYGYSAGGVLSRFLIPASMLIFYGQLRKKRKKKKVF